jgi:hypothetical protein
MVREAGGGEADAQPQKLWFSPQTKSACGRSAERVPMNTASQVLDVSLPNARASFTGKTATNITGLWLPTKGTCECRWIRVQCAGSLWPQPHHFHTEELSVTLQPVDQY